MFLDRPPWPDEVVGVRRISLPSVCCLREHECEMKGLPLGQLLTMFAVVIVIFGLFKSGFIGGGPPD